MSAIGPNPGRCPANPLQFIRGCVRDGAIFWTFHVNMRLRTRSIDQQEIIGAVDTFEIIESYPDDKYLPSYLIYLVAERQVYHAVVAVNVVDSSIRIVTVYKPDAKKWSMDLKRRLPK